MRLALFALVPFAFVPFAFVLFAFVWAIPAHALEPRPPRPATHRYTIERTTLAMRDGTRLAATIWSPIPRTPAERFPTILELLPYRKDDSFTLRDVPIYTYFAARGHRAVKVDVRGTGSSRGTLPDREYSDVELADAEEVIAQLARRPGANGRVGMWGISWGGFNAIQTAMRSPPALKAILAVDAADDLFHDDIHYIDGILHLDMYQLEIDHENGLPRTPDYPVDDDYLRTRFGRPPWLLTYLHHQRPGPFWSENSLRNQYDRLRIPAFLIGGLSDGYRDSIPRMLEQVRAPFRAPLRSWIGPWNHDFPDGGVPGPNAEWKEEALAWWDRWLGEGTRRAGSTATPEPAPLWLYVRAGHAPGLEGDAPGRWVEQAWPGVAHPWTLRTASGGRLTADKQVGVATLAYHPGTGLAGGDWWGETPGDQRADDAYALCFDTPPLTAPRVIAGMPRVRIRARTGAALVHWIARLEDVAPDGAVTLVTGAALNGDAHRGEVNADLPLHFTTWTFRAGHRVRLALTHAQFPMLWPTPEPATSCVQLGETALELPELATPGRPLTLFPPRAGVTLPDAHELGAEAEPARRTFTDPKTGELTYEMASTNAFHVRGNDIHTDGNVQWRVRQSDPAHARAIARMTTRVDRAGRRLVLSTEFTLSSNETHFTLDFRREISENGRRLAHRHWRESVQRDGQ